MNSPFANIFLALQARIHQLSSVQYIDQDLGQLKSAKPSLAFPAVLIDFEDFKFENLANNVQTAEGTIVLKLAFVPNSNSSHHTPSGYLQNAISFYDIEWNLHKIIQGWSPGNDFGHLSRIGTATQKRNDNIRVREIRYTLAFHDYSPQPATQWVEAQGNINSRIEI